MAFFSKSTPTDNTDVIYLDDTGKFLLPLKCDNDLYEKGIEKIKSILKAWILQDIIFTNMENGNKVDNSLVFQLKDIDTKFIPYDLQKNTLLSCLEDSATNFAGLRFFDTIVRISLEVPTEVLETLKGKFLYAMVYTIPKSINRNTVPTKQQWVSTLIELPWVTYLPFIQELYERDEEVGKLISKTGMNSQPNIVRVKDALAPTA